MGNQINQPQGEEGKDMSWMDAEQQKDFEAVCNIIDGVKTARQFYEACRKINSGKYDFDVVNAAREAKHFYNSAQYAE